MDLPPDLEEEVTQEAEQIAETTYLSEQEAIVNRLKEMGGSHESIADAMEVATGTVDAYSSRVHSKVKKAIRTIEAAEESRKAQASIEVYEFGNGPRMLVIDDFGSFSKLDLVDDFHSRDLGHPAELVVKEAREELGLEVLNRHEDDSDDWILSFARDVSEDEWESFIQTLQYRAPDDVTISPQESPPDNGHEEDDRFVVRVRWENLYAP